LEEFCDKLWKTCDRDKIEKYYNALGLKDAWVEGSLGGSSTRRIFDEFDRDGSGSIDREEFQQLCFRLGEPMTSEQVGEAMSSIDKDRNGTIDYDEFELWWDTPEKNVGVSSRRLKTAIMARESKRQAKKLFEELKASGYSRIDGDAVHTYKADVSVGASREEKSSVEFNFEANTGEKCSQDLKKLDAPPESKAAISLDFSLQGEGTPEEAGKVCKAWNDIISALKITPVWTELTESIPFFLDIKAASNASVVHLSLFFSEDPGPALAEVTGGQIDLARDIKSLSLKLSSPLSFEDVMRGPQAVWEDHETGKLSEDARGVLKSLYEALKEDAASPAPMSFKGNQVLTTTHTSSIAS